MCTQSENRVKRFVSKQFLKGCLKALVQGSLHHKKINISDGGMTGEMIVHQGRLLSYFRVDISLLILRTFTVFKKA